MMAKKNLFFLLFSMNLGGVEKSFLNFLYNIDLKEYDVHLGLLKREGDLLPMLPSEVAVHQCCAGEWEELNESPLLSIRKKIGKGKVLSAIKQGYAYLKSKFSNDKRPYLKYLLRNEPAIDIEFDEAHAFASPATVIDYFVINKVKADNKFSWIHFDVSKFYIDKVSSRRMYDSFNKIFVVSKGAMDKFLNLFPDLESKTELRHNLPSPKLLMEQASVASVFNDGFDGVKVLSIGRLEAEKGYDCAVEALSLIREKGINARLYIIGEGTQKQTLQDLSKKLQIEKNVVFLGRLLNPYGYLQQCDVYLQTSRQEGYCLALAEARIFNKPIVSTRFSNYVDALDDYENARIVDRHPNLVAEAIESIVSENL